MTKQEIIQAIQENKIQIKASTDAKFATIRWFDNDSQSWKEANTFIRDIIQGAENFADLANDTNAPGQNGQEVINNLYQVINQHTSDIAQNTSDIKNKLDKNQTVTADYGNQASFNVDASPQFAGYMTFSAINETEDKAARLRLQTGGRAQLLDFDYQPLLPTKPEEIAVKQYVDDLTKLNLVKLPFEQTAVGYVEFRVDLAKYPNGVQGTVALIENDNTVAYRSIPFYVQKGMNRINVGSGTSDSRYMYELNGIARFGFDAGPVKGTVEAILNVKPEDCSVAVSHPTRESSKQTEIGEE